MNKDNIKIVRDAIAADKINLEFNMDYGLQRDWCGTKACICGYAVAIFHDDPRYVEQFKGLDKDAFRGEYFDWWDLKRLGREILGLDADTAHELFIEFDGMEDYSDRDLAVKVLDELMETGQVHWPSDDDEDS